MKTNKTTKPENTRPRKVLLHVAKKNGQWAGKATDFNHNKEYRFSSIDDLFEWFEKQEAE